MSADMTTPDLVAVPRWTILMRDGALVRQQNGEHPTGALTAGEVIALAFSTEQADFVVAPSPGSAIDWLTTVDVGGIGGGEGWLLRRVGPGIRSENPVRLWVDPSGSVVVLADGPLEQAQAACLALGEACKREAG